MPIAYRLAISRSTTGILIANRLATGRPAASKPATSRPVTGKLAIGTTGTSTIVSQSANIITFFYNMIVFLS